MSDAAQTAAAPAEDAQPQWGVSVLKPRNPGERMKVQQAVLKKRDRNLAYQAERAKKIRQLVRNRKAKVKPSQLIRSAESFVAEALMKRSDSKRQDRANRGFLKKPKAGPNGYPLLFVVRNTYWRECYKTTKQLHRMRLKQPNHAVFMRNTDENLAKLERVKNFAYWGHPNKQTVTTLLKKMGTIWGKERGRKVYLSDNAIVEERFGDLGMLCVEDIVHEIYTLGPKFDEVNRKLCAFRVSDTRTNEKKTRDVKCLRGQQRKKINEILVGLIGQD